ncbi:MAG: DNA adenine methylase [Anaerolineae bacterium]|nr:DNA adenine methylase [Anaerolineae bacterium]
MSTPESGRSGRAAPFLKWAGGKQRLLDLYLPYFPAQGERYIEPFMGSAAVFFRLRAENRFREYVLSDSNFELVNCYRVVRDNLDALIEKLADHRDRHGKAHYEKVRAMDQRGLGLFTPVERAARFIYLNKTCYNGLWRVNRFGRFNVPMGRYTNPPILDEAKLRAASAALQGVDIRCEDFRMVETSGLARPGDVVYFDPPYHPASKTANFTAYQPDMFGVVEQGELAGMFRRLAALGCTVLLSNSDTPFVRAIYAGLETVPVQARRAINSRAASRGAVPELLILGQRA